MDIFDEIEETEEEENFLDGLEEVSDDLKEVEETEEEDDIFGDDEPEDVVVDEKEDEDDVFGEEAASDEKANEAEEESKGEEEEDVFSEEGEEDPFGSDEDSDDIVAEVDSVSIEEEGEEARSGDLEIFNSYRLTISADELPAIIEKYSDKVGTPVKPDPKKMFNEDGTLNVSYAQEMVEKSKSLDAEEESIKLLIKDLKIEIEHEMIRPIRGEFKNKTKEVQINFKVSV